MPRKMNYFCLSFPYGLRGLFHFCLMKMYIQNISCRLVSILIGLVFYSINLIFGALPCVFFHYRIIFIVWIMQIKSWVSISLRTNNISAVFLHPTKFIQLLGPLIANLKQTIYPSHGRGFSLRRDNALPCTRFYVHISMVYLLVFLRSMVCRDFRVLF